ncbi:MFS transporter [Candidatus Beckwithbacteria bacterium]|nr:MFS transporter [Candidatus Beckwithbacteria bacterium]
MSKYLPKLTKEFKFWSYTISSVFVAYILLIFMIDLADSFMSFVVPIYLEDNLKNSFWMGLVMSFSSLIGIITDIVLGEWFKEKKYNFFLIWAFGTALSFPFVLLSLPPIIPVFLLGMFIWGVYYELISFANYYFIRDYLTNDEHLSAWSIISIFRCSTYLIGPIIAEFLLEKGVAVPIFASLILVFVGSLLLILFMKTYHHKRNIKADTSKHKKSLLHEFKIWGTLMKVIWPLWLFSLVISLVDSAFWTVGIVLSEKMSDQGILGGFLLTAYMLPSLFIGIFSSKAARPFGKKKAALFSGLLNGLFLFIACFIADVNWFVVLVFIASCLGSLAGPEISATYEDYIVRLGNFGGDFIGLNQSSNSLAYVLGPIIAGFIAQLFGYRQTFAVIGTLLFLISLLAIIFTPRKIHMPQQELNQIK